MRGPLPRDTPATARRSNVNFVRPVPHEIHVRCGVGPSAWWCAGLFACGRWPGEHVGHDDGLLDHLARDRRDAGHRCPADHQRRFGARCPSCGARRVRLHAGVVPHLLAAATGAAAILHASGVAFEAIKVAGVLYLLWMAVATWRDRSELLVDDAPRSSPSTRSVLAASVLANLLNPKLTIFFFAFLPQFVSTSGARRRCRCSGSARCSCSWTFVSSRCMASRRPRYATGCCAARAWCAGCVRRSRSRSSRSCASRDRAALSARTAQRRHRRDTPASRGHLPRDAPAAARGSNVNFVRPVAHEIHVRS